MSRHADKLLRLLQAVRSVCSPAYAAEHAPTLAGSVAGRRTSDVRSLGSMLPRLAPPLPVGIARVLAAVDRVGDRERLACFAPPAAPAGVPDHPQAIAVTDEDPDVPVCGSELDGS